MVTSHPIDRSQLREKMRIQCDVCTEVEASVFCCADDAALCNDCDRRIHRANKLAGKHRRFSLHHPESRPICDVCQEKRAFTFCQQDRAILCTDCDTSIHSATALTMKHSRFLLTGTTLSSTTIPSPPPDSSLAVSSNKVKLTPVPSSPARSTDASCSSSSISEYLIKTLPGWHVEDFLTDDLAAGESLPAIAGGGVWGEDVFAVPQIYSNKRPRGNQWSA